MPKDDGYSEEDFQRLQKINGLDIRRFNYNSDILNKTLVVDRVESLVIEIKEEEERKEISGEDEEKNTWQLSLKNKYKCKIRIKTTTAKRKRNDFIQ
jgi:hypothetical protein